MSECKRDIFNQAMRKAAWTVKNGTREERSGRFLQHDQLVIARDAKTGEFVKAPVRKRSSRTFMSTNKKRK